MPTFGDELGSDVMMRWRASILVAVVTAVLSGPVYGGMVAVRAVRDDSGLVTSAKPRASVRTSMAASSDLGVDPLDGRCMDLGLVADVTEEAPASDVPQAVTVLADRQTSMTFCCYALMAFGLCKSVSRVRRFTCGVIPEWYHDGGPYQIGHSVRAAPSCLCSTQVCFVQPGPSADISVRRPNWMGFVSLWWKSQSSRIVVAGRGPPLLARESFVA